MKLLAFFILLLNVSMAQAIDCHLFEVKGEVQSLDNRLVIRLGEDSLSDLKLPIPIDEQLKALPLLDEWTRSLIVVKGNSLSMMSEIIKIQSIEIAPRDPLNDVPQETRRMKGEVPCP